jgi:hypothetical protein
MEKYTKAVLAVVALCVLALPLKAEEKVWYCEMTGLAQTTDKGVETFKTEKFKIKVNAELVRFGKGGYTDDLEMPIRWWGDMNNWQALDKFSSLYFTDGMLHYAIALSKYAIAFSARCDDF